MRQVQRGVFIAGQVNWILLPALQDNYILLLQHLPSNEVLCFDPGEWSPIANQLKTLKSAPIRRVYLTHPHQDHIGGLSELLKNQNCKVYSPEDERLKEYGAQSLQDNETQLIWNSLKITALSTPGHTIPALSFLVEAILPEGAALPTLLVAGDTVFVSGCGRLFEGDASMMWQSLSNLRDRVPPHALFFCGHEYSLRNTHFVREKLASWRSLEIQTRLSKLEEALSLTQSSLPQIWGDEIRANPFLNTDDPELARALGLEASKDPSLVFTQLRIMRNSF